MVHLGYLNPITASSPSRIAQAFASQWHNGAILKNSRIFLFELTVGFTLAFIVGVTLGIAMGVNRLVEYAADPFVWLIYASPTIAFYPLLMIWIGFGSATVITVTFLLTFVSIVVNTMAGVHAAEPQMIRVLKVFGGKPIDIILKVIIPASLPLMLAGVRIGLSRAFLGVILGEMFSSNAGFGYDIAYYAGQLQTATVFVSIIILIVIGTIINLLFTAVEARLFAWKAR